MKRLIYSDIDLKTIDPNDPNVDYVDIFLDTYPTPSKFEHKYRGLGGPIKKASNVEWGLFTNLDEVKTTYMGQKLLDDGWSWVVIEMLDGTFFLTTFDPEYKELNTYMDEGSSYNDCINSAKETITSHIRETLFYL